MLDPTADCGWDRSSPSRPTLPAQGEKFKTNSIKYGTSFEVELQK